MCSGIGLAISSCSRCQSCLHHPSTGFFCLKQPSVEVVLLLSSELDLVFFDLDWESYYCSSQDKFDRNVNPANELLASQVDCLTDLQRNLSLSSFGLSLLY